jgi:prepilin-type N-terminal cleavage/methylation domain-containing protein
MIQPKGCKSMKFKVGTKNKNYGFTIIEVMLVIAIAGLIMAIVFLGVPQLQRSQRDSQRKVYLRQVYQEVLEYLKNNGRLPSDDAESRRLLEKYLPTGKDPLTGEDYIDKSGIPAAPNFSATIWHVGNTFYDYRSASHAAAAAINDSNPFSSPKPSEDIVGLKRIKRHGTQYPVMVLLVLNHIQEILL